MGSVEIAATASWASVTSRRSVWSRAWAASTRLSRSGSGDWWAVRKIVLASTGPIPAKSVVYARAASAWISV